MVEYWIKGKLEFVYLQLVVFYCYSLCTWEERKCERKGGRMRKMRKGDERRPREVERAELKNTLKRGKRRRRKKR